MSALRVALIVLVCAGIADTAVVSLYSNVNAGTVFPAILGFPLLVIGVFYGPATEFFRAGAGLIVKWLLIAAYAGYALFLLVTIPMLYSAGHKAPRQNADALIVLGCGVRGERVSLTLANRLDAALAYMEQNPRAVAVLSGGQGPGENLPEAEAMFRYMVAHGADESRLRKEAASQSTYDNFRYSFEIIREELGGNAEIAFVTTDFHVLRAERVAAKLGLNADGFGAPGVKWIAPNDYLRESMVLVYYFIKGRI